ncbi:MAG: LamG domain-containing protein [Polyangiaceae bacterium]
MRQAWFWSVGVLLACSSSSRVGHVSSDAGTGGTAGNGGSTGGTGATGTGGQSEVCPDAGQGGAAGQSASYAATILTDCPYGYWRLEEGAPGTFTSLGPSKKTGSADGFLEATQLQQPGVAEGFGVLTNDTGTAISWQQDPKFRFVGSQAFSVEVWLKPEGTGSGPILASHGDLTGWRLSDDNDGLSFVRTQQPGQADRALGSLPTQAWSHVVATYDGSDLCLYRNGKVEQCVPSTRTLGAHNEGIRAGAPLGEAAYFGLLDEVALYLHALTPERIQAHYAAGLVLPDGGGADASSGDAGDLDASGGG